ncbi:unnamed protein product [Psylliodes chrysocephalus]|uniref:DNA endonuclease RBBP8 n=1 Tax=Psylliodes chrysocephalus TaxID=3402493 RepID=A0A9P0DDQ0_9CUCU|nr:unnamed protein product [Psylliodes chrysocephala]
METEAFKFWTDIFDTTLLDSYRNERKELQKAAMLITAFQIEIKNVQQSFEKEFSILREQLKRKDEIEEKVKSLPAENDCVQNSNLNDDITELDTNISLQNSDLDTPDIFANSSTSNKSSNSEVIDITLSDVDATNLENSPTLVSKRKNKSKRQTKKIYGDLKKNIFKEVDKENSMLVECTPEVKVKKRTSNNGFLSKKIKKKSTLTQMFSDISKSTKNIFISNQSEFDENQTNSNNTTYLKEDTTELGITRLLSYINKDENENPVQNDNSVEDEMDSAQDVDEFSKGILFDEESPVQGSPNKKFKPCESLVEPGLRGKAKKMLKGFSCDKCRYFYGAMKLSPKELQKRIDECSNHRYKYNPPEDTFEGIWDLTIPEEKVKKK